MKPELGHHVKVTLNGKTVVAGEIVIYDRSAPALGQLVVDLGFKPNWVGVFKLQGLLADQEPEE